MDSINGFKALLGQTQFDSDESTIQQLEVSNINVVGEIDLSESTITGITTDDVTEAKSLYYTETRVSNNTNVLANTAHRGQTDNPHSVTPLQVGITNLGSASIITAAERTQITTNQSAVSTNASAITTNSTDISAAQSDIKTLTTDLDALEVTVDDIDLRSGSNLAAITAMQSDVDANNLKRTYPLADETKVGYISVTQAVDLDQMETDIALNNAKNSYPTADATKLAGIAAGADVTADTALLRSGGVMTGQITFSGGQLINSNSLSNLVANATDVKGLTIDNTLCRMEGTTGRYIHDSQVVLDDSGNLSGIANITLTGLVDGRDVALDGTTLDSLSANALTSADDTDDLSEGSSNLYYTDARVAAAPAVTTLQSDIKDYVPLAGASMTGRLGVPVGTAALPGLFISGDSGTGLSQVAADTLSLSADGAERLRLTSTKLLSYHSESFTTPAYSFATETTSGMNVGNAGNNDLTLIYRGTAVLRMTNQWSTFYNTSGIRPGVDNSIDIGSSSRRWDDIYATSGVIQTSDGQDKENISNSDLGLDFIKKLRPKKYKWRKGTRPHYGLLSQDVERVVNEQKQDFAGFVKTTVPVYAQVNGEDDLTDQIGTREVYGLRYHEFIAPMLKAIQELSDEVDRLKADIRKLKKK